MRMIFLLGLIGLASCVDEVNIQISVASCKEKVHVRIYGEQLCPDTTRFLQQQLSPFISDSRLLECTDIVYVPFGKAECDENNRCTCQHGPLECKGSQLQNLVLDSAKELKDALATIVCLQGEPINKGAKDCFRWLNTDPEQFIAIAKGEKGRELLAKAGRETPPHLSYVPWIEINGVRDRGAEYGLKHAVCAHLSGVESCEE